jgi:hypothetical protein
MFHVERGVQKLLDDPDVGLGNQDVNFALEFGEINLRLYRGQK